MSRLVAVLALAATLVACTAPSRTSPAPPQPAALPTDVPQPSQSAAASGDGDPRLAQFIPGDVVAITAKSVAVHDEATEASQQTGNLTNGDVVRVISFATIDDARRLWLMVVDLNLPDQGRLPDLPETIPEPEFALQGWILAGDGSTANVASIAPRCPQTVDLVNVTAMFAGERLACFGRRLLTLDGLTACVPCLPDAGTYDPAWLAGGASLNLSTTFGSGFLGLFVPPPFAAPPHLNPIRVTGHFDDPRSEACRATVDGVEYPRAAMVELCRRRFVLESLEVLPKPTPNPLE